MKVKVKDTIVGEQKSVQDGEPEIGYVSEMVSEPAKLKDFGFGPDVVARANALKETNEDESPEYPVVRVEEGWSRSGRLWDANELEQIVAQTNQLEPVGHLGHIPDDQAAFAFPPPQTSWIGAITKMEPSQQKERVGEMVKVAYFTGYNLPGSELRAKKYIKNKVVRGISWWGVGDEIPVPGRGVQVRNFTLRALDWARKLSEGMPTSRIVAMAREMEGSKMEKELSQVTPDEFKTANPNGYALLVKEVEDKSVEKIGEMDKKIEEGDKAKSLLTKACEAIGVTEPDKLVDELTALKAKVGEKAAALVKSALDTFLEEKVPNEERRALVRRLLPVGEMESKAAEAKDGEAVTKLVGEMVDDVFSKDEVVKNILGETQPPVVRRREELGSKQGGDKDNEYIRDRSRVSLS